MDYKIVLEEINFKLHQLESYKHEKGINFQEEEKKLKDYKNDLVAKIDASLENSDIVALSRQSKRPQSLDYINAIFDDFIELHGDRVYGDDKAIIAGFARIDKQKFLVIANQKGRKIEEKIERNFGMAYPEGYRKVLRLAKLAEKFKLPIISFIDTPGAHPGLEAERRGQSVAISSNIYEFSDLKTPIIAIIISEGGSGGSLAMALADKVFMLKYANFSVISPEAASIIMYRNTDKAGELAKHLKISSKEIFDFGLIDGIIYEDIDNNYLDMNCSSFNIKSIILQTFSELKKISIEKLIENRYNKYRNIKL